MIAEIETPATKAYKMGVHEAKRWLKDQEFGYPVLRMLLRDGELTNRTMNSEYMDNFGQWQEVTFVWVGNHTLVVNHTDRKLYWQE